MKKVLSSVLSVVFLAIAAFYGWEAIKDYRYANSTENIEKESMSLIVDGIRGNEIMSKLAKVNEVTSVTLMKTEEKNGTTTYKGVAKVSLNPRDVESSDEKVIYSKNTIIVTYDVEIMYDGRNLLLSNAEMEDADFAKLLEAAGVDADEE